MDIFALFTKFIEGIIYYIAVFLYSPAFPYFFWTVLSLFAFYLLVRLYLFIRDKCLPNITYERRFSEAGVYSGDEVELIETVVNRGFFPLFAVDVEAYMYNELRLSGYEPPRRDGMQYFISRFNLLPYMRIRRRHRVVCLARGVYSLQSATVVRRSGALVFDCPASICVYPRPIPVGSIPVAAGRAEGAVRAARRLFADPFTVSGVRDYRFGDPTSQINFKVSARTYMGAGGSSSPLKVNERDYCADRRTAVYMDFHLERGSGIDGAAYLRRAEAGLSYAAAIIRETIYGGYRASFCSNCRTEDGAQAQRLPLASGEEHMLSIFRTMASLRPADGASFVSLLDETVYRGDSDTEIIIIVFCPSEEIDDRILRLERLGNSVLMLVLSEEDETCGTDVGTAFGTASAAEIGTAVNNSSPTLRERSDVK